MSNTSHKNSINLLQELCATTGVNPNYQLVSVEGAVHKPTFTYRVQVNEEAATATGQTKKKAKHAAAKALLEILLSENGLFKDGFVSGGVHVNHRSLNDIITESVPSPINEKHPISALQEFCMKMKWQLPYYEKECVVGLPQERAFCVKCKTDKFLASGEGRNERLAKRQAAENMLNTLKAQNIILGANEPEDEVSSSGYTFSNGSSDEEEGEAEKGSNEPQDGVSSSSTLAFSDQNSDGASISEG